MADAVPQAGAKGTAFGIKDCALVVLATGRKARLLQELRSEVSHADTASIYHHFWGSLLQPRLEEREYNNDFAEWVRHGVHDPTLAERLAALSPTNYPDLEALRREMIELIDTRLDEAGHHAFAPATTQFELARSQIVVFDTGRRLAHPRELTASIPDLTTGSIFYHFVDARRRTADGRDDFSDWLAIFGSEVEPLREQLAAVDPYFGGLHALRDELAELFAIHFPEVAP